MLDECWTILKNLINSSFRASVVELIAFFFGQNAISEKLTFLALLGNYVLEYVVSASSPGWSLF